MLYPCVSYYEASPKAISRRTSYIRVRLEFHRYPHVIPTLFNVYGFGPPRDFTLASTCTWIGHPVSGLQHATTALFRLAFATAPVGSLNQATAYESPAHSSTGTRSEPWAPPTAWELTVSCSISLPDGGSFHPSLTVLLHYRSPRSI